MNETKKYEDIKPVQGIAYHQTHTFKLRYIDVILRTAPSVLLDILMFKLIYCFEKYSLQKRTMNL
jgi:hypothetical protein